MKLLSAAQLIATLQLSRHPEGGWFRETYRSAALLSAAQLPDRCGGSRSMGTAIYFLLEQGDFSALHRIKSDELWHFYSGSPLLIHTITPGGSYQALRLGADFSAGEQFQAVVPAGCWFGAELQGEGFTLVGCTVSPGFAFEDFELADRQLLQQQYPLHADLVERMTRS